MLTAVETPVSNALPRILKLALTLTPSISKTPLLMTAFMHLSAIFQIEPKYIEVWCSFAAQTARYKVQCWSSLLTFIIHLKLFHVLVIFHAFNLKLGDMDWSRLDSGTFYVIKRKSYSESLFKNILSTIIFSPHDSKYNVLNIWVINSILNDVIVHFPTGAVCGINM